MGAQMYTSALIDTANFSDFVNTHRHLHRSMVRIAWCDI